VFDRQPLELLGVDSPTFLGGWTARGAPWAAWAAGPLTRRLPSPRQTAPIPRIDGHYTDPIANPPPEERQSPNSTRGHTRSVRFTANGHEGPRTSALLPWAPVEWNAYSRKLPSP